MSPCSTESCDTENRLSLWTTGGSGRLLPEHHGLWMTLSAVESSSSLDGFDGHGFAIPA